MREGKLSFRAGFTTGLTRLQPRAPAFRGPIKSVVQRSMCHVVHCDSPEISAI